jgi:DMSO reductase family type II enzyme chaperone
VSPSDTERHGRAALRGAAVYRALSLGFSEPDETLVQALVDGDLAGELRDAVDGLGAGEDCAAAAREVERCAAAAAGARVGDVLRDLQAEYARLFTGPGRPAVACYESEYLEQPRADGRGRLGGLVAGAVESAYLRESVTIAAVRREPPDFVAVELEFLYVLHSREAEAWAAGDEARARRLHLASEQFLEEHAQRWLPAFAGAARAESRRPFYAALSGVLGCFLAAHRSRGADRRPGALQADGCVDESKRAGGGTSRAGG